MSLILEALRKSEAERRRGMAPDVAMELPPLPSARASALPPWLWPAVLLAAIALMAGWLWLPRGDADDADHVELAAAAPSPAAPIEAPPQPVVVARPASPAVASPPAPAPTAPPATPVPRQVPPASSAASAPPENLPRPPLVPAPVAPAGQIDVPDIDALPMPPVRLSMHIWDESPARRFVILDGQRMGEGDRSGDLRVVAIERNGVIVERNGTRARVPLP